MTDDSSQYYLVFASQAVTVQSAQPVQVGARSYEYANRATGELAWTSTPVGVFRGESPEAACHAAAAKVGSGGTFFAVAGTPWGLSMQPATATELGAFNTSAPGLPAGD